MVREMTSYSYCAALRALRPGFYPVFREQSGCSPSVVAVVGRCNGIMSNPNANPYQPQPQPGPQKNKTSRRFFTWVRSSGLVRGDDRWIGGVCSGIALRLGWSPTLVRALVIVCTLFFGFGAALYALGWFLMPDVRDGHILAEDLIAGQWDWNCLGCFLFLAVAIVIPGAGWVCIALAALALWLLAKSGIRQQEGYGFRASATRPVSQPVSYPAPQPVSYPAAQPVPQSPLYSAPQPVSQPVSRTETSVSQPFYQSVTGAVPGAVPGVMPSTVPNGPFAHDRMNATAYAPTESKRRKPAGPIVVLSILGLTFLSFAGLMGLIWVNDMGIIGIMRLSTIWIAAVCIVMGLVVIILGFKGRRTGGLIPLGLVAGGCALCMTIVSGTSGVYYRDFGASGINTVVSLSQSVSARNSDGMNDVQKDGIFVADASDATFETLQQGVAFSGENYNTDQAIIDWSDWGKIHGPHTVKMLDGKTSISNCPVGTITIAATQAQVHIVLPDSCTYAFGTADSYSTSSGVGGKYEMVYNNYMGLSFGFFEAESATNPMNGPDYEWLDKGSAMPDNGPELKINIPYAVEARVNVVYASGWKGSTFQPLADIYDGNSTSKNTTEQSE
ncbi:phage shock protein C [Bifidobacterium longum subsp. infantis]|uniref:PspC domain protein n=2 Tax=Bifidobacterium longum subsp. infantis TaxID=1682 RepID=A0ABM9R7A8_BIFLI|nr:PspC domain-containing protein [Bifidobacterium longum subsp. infantis]CEF01440.1 PspC domain protein [Bifidobacterium longum subsp. infantis]CEF05112.1 PspC domain protein [Bifidobacterium longum subsp. infantis]CEF06168.1 PspC domain protein [Bifidobacterium longum subsp. infantis]CEF10935.1 PspC domain protein [Bifidobacterium longum subsp. infantis]